MGILQIAAYVPAKKWYISKSGIKGPTQFRGNMLFTHIKMSQNAGWWTPLIVLDAIGPRCQRVDQLTPTNFSVFLVQIDNINVPFMMNY